MCAADLEQGGDQLERPDKLRARHFLLLLFFSLVAAAVMGYHPGIEDDGVYLSAIKSDLNPALYPHDSRFFRLQLQATVFDRAMAGFVRLTHISLPYAELLLQFASILLILASCRSIARLLFKEERAHWAGVALVGAMMTLPVSGTALYLVDQHLHPRTIATALILLAVSRIMRGRLGQAVPLIVLALVMHPIMAALGISFCVFLTLAMHERVHAWVRSLGNTAAAAVPLGWVFESPTPIWHRALATRNYYFLYEWTWYEWLGALGPLFLFWLLWRIALRRGETMLARFSLAVLGYGVFQQIVAMIVLKSPSLVRLTPLQPMRYLHLIYFFLVLVGGCLLGKYLLKGSTLRWAIFLSVINIGMFVSQRALFRGSDHMEWPWAVPSNPWVQAFAWVRTHTPRDAYFAMDPYYLGLPGEDYHSFRALAERSQLADMIKDPSVVTQVPELGPEWGREVEATSGWRNFRAADFERLKRDFGVNWVLVTNTGGKGLLCQWHNQAVAVCRIP
jgi:hypothetical protein